MRVVPITTVEQRKALADARGLRPFDARLLASHATDVHFCAQDRNGEVRAYCSLWWNAAPWLSGRKTGAIGHYASADDEAGAALLEAAVERLRERGCAMAMGPMDGNTWRSYRFVTGGGSSSPEPPFFLEPANPPEWPRQFERAGFAKVAGYYSALNCDVGRPDERIERAAARLEEEGVRIRSCANADLRVELKRIYRVSRVAFARNFLYTELGENDFISQYAGMLSRVQPELLLLAERGGDLAGYVFAVPDFAQAARGETIDTFIIKTVAILPEQGLRGLGGVLVGRVQQAGHRLGFRRCIHALMHEDNPSLRISRHYAAMMRRYTLYGREIAS